MHCDLMESNGLRGDCSAGGCVYWGVLGEGEDRCEQCALGYYGLVGPRRDRLAKWLLELKIKSRAIPEHYARSEAYAANARSRAAEWSSNGAG